MRGCFIALNDRRTNLVKLTHFLQRQRTRIGPAPAPCRHRRTFEGGNRNGHRCSPWLVRLEDDRPDGIRHRVLWIILAVRSARRNDGGSAAVGCRWRQRQFSQPEQSAIAVDLFLNLRNQRVERGVSHLSGARTDIASARRLRQAAWRGSSFRDAGGVRSTVPRPGPT